MDSLRSPFFCNRPRILRVPACYFSVLLLDRFFLSSLWSRIGVFSSDADERPSIMKAVFYPFLPWGSDPRVRSFPRGEGYA